MDHKLILANAGKGRQGEAGRGLREGGGCLRDRTDTVPAMGRVQRWWEGEGADTEVGRAGVAWQAAGFGAIL